MALPEKFFFFDKSKQYSPIPGSMQDVHFLLLIEVSSLHSEKVINALRDFLVDGYTRREVCERHKVSPGYFSVALRKLQRIEQAIFQLAPYYISLGERARK
ncbi:adhesin biosynthesis transcription regulatory family protein [Escherichia coli]|uniref:adhesin biosynthesis transcription regulatory family protein n=1 Tax=Escherichia coli TaxID=562 RepID=UPI000D16FF9A|nr:adhesin biosynthesis transcription regulatory family protein [Escherichia coli]EBH7349113.1 transcriptional regulator [Salmonella enterica]EDH0372784.1 transcriptional regulator [Salmonella enterica subsp. enterica serovar Typhimurium]EDS5872363.1 transcriptional regulator [Salmonella enterica subsp. enterica serovar Mississippi]EEV1142024.1 transcriptional regulator [Escherichia coli O157:H7]EFN6672775.1 transcriptional regulator [Escherichia coli O8:H10]EHG0168956.1 transcriptional regul